MAIVKKNLYTIGDNSTITNLVENTPMFNLDKTFITYSAPNILVKVGSQIECNGNLYVVETSDISITAANGNLAFNSNTLTFSISASAYTYNNLKRGDYIDANTRVCRWRMNSSGQYAIRQDSNFAIRSKRNILYGEWANESEFNSFITLLSPYITKTGDKLKCSGFGFIRENRSRIIGDCFKKYYLSKVVYDSGIKLFGYFKDESYSSTVISYDVSNYIYNDGFFNDITEFRGCCAVEIP